MAIEGSGNFGRPAAEALVKAGVGSWWRSPLEMTAAARRARRTGAKTDQIDTSGDRPYRRRRRRLAAASLRS